MTIKHPALKLASCCLLAASLLPACGGGSSSGGGVESRSYQQGVAHGTATTLELVLDDLQALQASLAGSGAPVQTSSLGREVTISVNSLNLEPRRRADLAAQLSTFIARLRMAQEAAAAANAGQAEADAAQTAAAAALQALRLVVAADIATQAGAGNAAQEAAIAALTQIAAVEPDAPDAAAAINRALTAALEAQVAQLERDLAAANAALGAQEGMQSTVADLTAALNAARADLAAAENRLNALNAEFGAAPATAALTPAALPAASVAYHPRRTGVQVYFGSGFDPASSTWSIATRYTVHDFGAAATDGPDLTPDPVVYNPQGSNRRVFAASSPNPGLFPARGTVYRGVLRRVLSTDRDDSDAGTDTSIVAGDRGTWVYRDTDRLIRMGADPSPEFPASGASNSGWNNWDATPRTTFQYRPSGGLTMSFGGEGVIFGDLERYAAKGGRNCGSGGNEYCDESVTTNVETAFGSPAADPFRQPHTNFWVVQVPSPRLPGDQAAVDAATAVTPDLGQAGGQIEGLDGGRYELVLSNYAGVDDQGTPAAADDAERLLSYAAYGLFQFTDFLTFTPRVARMQTFHYGVDAFSGAAGRGTADLAGNDTIEGTFQGKTLGWIVTGADKTQRNGLIYNLFRTRGDIELRACIGGAACALQDFSASPSALAGNRISGRITNLEYAHDNRSDNTYWTQGNLIGPGFRNTTVTLNTAVITDEGTYSGTVAGQSGTRPGTYEGAFYGPVGAGLETAGTWQLGAPDWANWDGIIGSFGAVCAAGCAPATP